MTSNLKITSPQNALIKQLAKLKTKRYRDKEKRYLIEGARELSRALDAGVHCSHILYCPELLKPKTLAFIEHLPHKMIASSEQAFKKLSLRQQPDGIIGVALINDVDLTQIVLKENALILVLDGLEKPGNIGALLRTADAANLDLVFLSNKQTDLYNPNVIRASLGSVFSRPVISKEAPEILDFLQQAGVQIVAASPYAPSLYWQASFTKPTAMVLGTEHEGLSQTWLKAATTSVRIPMNEHGLADSLNVATAGALLIYEALRQRRS